MSGLFSAIGGALGTVFGPVGTAIGGGLGGLVDGATSGAANTAGAQAGAQPSIYAAQQQAQAANASQNSANQIYSNNLGMALPAYNRAQDAAALMGQGSGVAPTVYHASVGGGMSPAAAGVTGSNGQVIPGTGGASAPGTGAQGPNAGKDWSQVNPGWSANSQEDYAGYLKANPKVADEWTKLYNSGASQKLFPGGYQQYVDWHYNQYGPKGQNQGYTMPMIGAAPAVAQA